MSVPLVLGSPELDTALQVWPLQGGVEWKDRQKSCPAAVPALLLQQWQDCGGQQPLGMGGRCVGIM